MELVQQFFQEALRIFFDLDGWLNGLAASLGPWLYLILFAIIFCETGLVVTPFLPGDSLLFAVGALAASEGSPLSLPWLIGLLIVAAVIGDAVNYAIGSYVGPKVFASERSRFFRKEHLLRTHEFYERYGGKTIVLARFVPIIRTFAPFVAGIAQMTYRRFAIYNVAGGIAWVVLFLVGGYVFGNAPIVKRNFHIVIVGIIFVSVLPIVIEYLLSRRRRARAAAESVRLRESPLNNVNSPVGLGTDNPSNV